MENMDNKIHCYAIGYGIVATVDQKRYDTPRKIGEKVRIKSKLNSNMPFGINDNMIAMCGKVVTIKDRHLVNYTDKFENIWSYKLLETGYNWNEFMFEQEEWTTYEVE